MNAEFNRNFIYGMILSYPLAVYIGKKKQLKQGVPLVQKNKFIEDWVNVKPNWKTWRVWRKYTIGTMLVGGFIFAHIKTDWSVLHNEFYSRPDLKPYPAMVKEPTDYDANAYQQLLEKNYYGQKQLQKEYKKSTWYRILYPEYADFTPRTNRFINRDPTTNYNYKTGAFPLYSQTYADHQA